MFLLTEPLDAQTSKELLLPLGITIILFCGSLKRSPCRTKTFCRSVPSVVRDSDIENEPTRHAADSTSL